MKKHILEKIKIELFTFGGTIDSYSDLSQDGKIVPCGVSVVKKFFISLKPYFIFHHTPISQKDSRDINEDDRKKLLDNIVKKNIKYSLITHGTYTMPETARFLKEKIGNNLKDKVVILTGSMSTLIGTINNKGYLIPSDGTFNLGFSVAAFASLEPGIYICMNGRIFNPDKVKKNTQSLRFFE